MMDRKWLCMIVVALITGMLTVAAPAQDWDDYEWDPTWGLHEEEWYDPSDWFDVDEGIEYEDYGWLGTDDYGYDYDYGYGLYDGELYDDYGYRYEYGYDPYDDYEYDWWEGEYEYEEQGPYGEYEYEYDPWEGEQEFEYETNYYTDDWYEYDDEFNEWYSDDWWF